MHIYTFCTLLQMNTLLHKYVVWILLTDEYTQCRQIQDQQEQSTRTLIINQAVGPTKSE
jgi:hypothetical protein